MYVAATVQLRQAYCRSSLHSTHAKHTQHPTHLMTYVIRAPIKIY